MKLTITAFAIALIAVAALFAAASSSGFAGLAEQSPKGPAKPRVMSAEKGQPQEAGGTCLTYCLVSAALLLGGMVSAVYALGVWSLEKGPLSRGVASIKAAFFLSLGGVLLGSSLAVYGAFTGNSLAAALGVLAVAVNLYVTYRAWAGAKRFRALLEGGA